MSFASLGLTSTYAAAGAFRLAHDRALWVPMWRTVRPVARRAFLVALVWAVLTWPIQQLIVSVFMKHSARVVDLSGVYNTVAYFFAYLPLIGWLPLPSLLVFATLIMILGQCQVIIEFLLRRELRVFRRRAYHATIELSKYSAEWWIPYVEEWHDPPYHEAHMLAAKKPLYRRWANTLVRGLLLRGIMFALGFVPFLYMGVSAYFRSFEYSQQLLAPYFKQKKMTPEQVNLFITERHLPLRLFAFSCACLERVPLAGTFFSISSNVGAALLAEDMEKRQHLSAAGKIPKVKPLPHLKLSDPEHLQAHLLRAISLSDSVWPFDLWDKASEVEPASPSPRSEDAALSTATTDSALEPTVAGVQLTRTDDVAISTAVADGASQPPLDGVRLTHDVHQTAASP